MLHHPFTVATESVIDGRFRLLQQVATDAVGSVFDALDEQTGEVVRLRRPSGDVDRRQLGILHPTLAHPIAIAEDDRFVVYQDTGELPYDPNADPRAPLDRFRSAAAELLPLFEALHTHEVVHGGLSLQSVWADPEGRLRVVDLGLQPTSAGARDDVFALASLLYTVAEGQAPCLGEGGRAPYAANLPHAVARVLMHAMDPRPVFRPSDAAELRKWVDEALEIIDQAADAPAEPATMDRPPLRIVAAPASWSIPLVVVSLASAALALAATAVFAVTLAAVTLTR